MSTEEWEVRLVGHEFDLTTLADSLGNGEVTIRRDEDDGWILISERFTSLQDAGEVRTEAQTLVRQLSGLAKLRKP